MLLYIFINNLHFFAHFRKLYKNGVKLYLYLCNILFSLHIMLRLTVSVDVVLVNSFLSAIQYFNVWIINILFILLLMNIISYFPRINNLL